MLPLGCGPPAKRKTGSWPSNARGAVSKGITLKYQALHGHERPEGWKGGGQLYPGFTKDDTQWNWWLNYRRLMNTPA